MTREAAFLAGIQADPDDDVLRLVYADWLEDQGHPERAEWVRDQVLWLPGLPLPRPPWL